MNYHVCLLLIMLIQLPCVAQITTPLEGWQSHLPYQSARWVTQSDDKIIYSTEWSIMTLDKGDLSQAFLTKVDGLSDVGIFRIKYDPFNDQLIIAYNNSNIDVVRGNEVINLPNVMTNQAITGDRLIYDIHIQDDQTAILATGFGAVELNTRDLNFGFTTKARRFNGVSTLQDYIYATSEEGIYRVQRSNQVFPGDFSAWDLLTEASGLPLVYEAGAIVSHYDRIYVVLNEQTVWKSDTGGTTFELIYEHSDPEFKISYLSADGAHLVVGLRDESAASLTTLIDEDDQAREIKDGCINRVLYGIEDQQSRIWYADEWDLIRYHEAEATACRKFTADSPYSHQNSDVSIKDSKVYVASGGVSDNFTYLFSRRGAYILSEGSWNNVNQDVITLFRDEDILNFYRILADPKSEDVYIGTYWAGLVQYNEDSGDINIYNQENSTLRGAQGDEARERISGLVFDDEDRLWIANFGAPKPISVLTPEGNWHSYSTGAALNLTDPVIDDNDNKWFSIYGNNGGILVYDHGENVQDPTDDRRRIINSNNSEITTNIVSAIAVDRDGSVWVGTGKGPVIFDCASDPFTSDCRGRRIKVTQDSIGAFLLADVDIRTIAIDGANRKWFGTRNGIFVQSSSGDEQALRFTANNSPLFDDNVIDLAYNGQTGEMYIATDKGLQSYRTKTTIGGRRHSRNVYSFPSPVPPDYEGPIGIKGLADDVTVKITDMNGKLVNELKSLGGQAIWDAKDFRGLRVKSGVYLVFSSTNDIFSDLDSYVTKIMIVR